jgi:quercetin dioxygenase-like cupin family protein
MVMQEDGMQRALMVVGVAMVLTLTWAVGSGQVQAKASKKKDLIFVSAEDAKFKDVVPGVAKAVLWGNHDKGPYGAFTKFAPGVDAGMHTHTNDLRIVVLKGAYLYKDDAGEKRVGPGQFIQLPGGRKHWSGGDKQEGALFYEESSGKFDLIPTK